MIVIHVPVDEVFCFVSFSILAQINAAERAEKKSELMAAGFNLTHDKVLNTDYFKVEVF